EAGGHGDALLEVDAHAVCNAGRAQESRGGAVNQVIRAGREMGIGASKLYSLALARETQAVAKRDRMHDRLQFVETIGTPSQNVKQQIDFAGRKTFQNHSRERTPVCITGWANVQRPTSNFERSMNCRSRRQETLTNSAFHLPFRWLSYQKCGSGCPEPLGSH